MPSKKELGQYFTVNEDIQQYVFDLCQNKGGVLLEPSFGAGHLLGKFLAWDPLYPMVCCEIDETIDPIVEFGEAQDVKYGNFMDLQLSGGFETIVANPPYVKQRGGRNLYIRFIEKCFELLAEDGEMIFIVPSDFIKLTSAATIIEKMGSAGSFTDFWFPHNERLFENAAIDVVVFRYQKGLEKATAVVNNEEKLCNINKGIITFGDRQVEGCSVEDLFDVYVGIVSGRDEIYRVPFGNVEVLSDKGHVEKFIFVEKFPSGVGEIDAHLEAHKEALIERRIKKFNESNWWAWGAPRNLTSIRARLGKPCIYVRNITRSKEVAFVGEVQLFGGGLLCLVPRQEGVDLGAVVAYFNSAEFQKDYMYAGRFKIGHKQVSSALLPH